MIDSSTQDFGFKDFGDELLEPNLPLELEIKTYKNDNTQYLQIYKKGSWRCSGCKYMNDIKPLFKNQRVRCEHCNKQKESRYKNICESCFRPSSKKGYYKCDYCVGKRIFFGVYSKSINRGELEYKHIENAAKKCAGCLQNEWSILDINNIKVCSDCDKKYDGNVKTLCSLGFCLEYNSTKRVRRKKEVKTVPQEISVSFDWSCYVCGYTNYVDDVNCKKCNQSIEHICEACFSNEANIEHINGMKVCPTCIFLRGHEDLISLHEVLVRNNTKCAECNRYFISIGNKETRCVKCSGDLQKAQEVFHTTNDSIFNKN